MSGVTDLRVMMQAQWVELAALADECWVNIHDINGRAYILARCKEIVTLDRDRTLVDDVKVLATYGLDDQPIYSRVDPRVASAIVFREAPIALVQRLFRDGCIGNPVVANPAALVATTYPSPDQRAVIEFIAQQSRLVKTNVASIMADVTSLVATLTLQTVVAPRTGIDGFLDAVKADFESKQGVARMFGNVVNVPAKTFYAKYVEWSEARGERPSTIHIFGRDIKVRVASSRATEGIVYKIDRIEP